MEKARPDTRVHIVILCLGCSGQTSMLIDGLVLRHYSVLPSLHSSCTESRRLTANVSNFSCQLRSTELLV